MAEALPSVDDGDVILYNKDLSILLDLLGKIAHKWEEISTVLPNLSESSISDIKGEQCEPTKKLLHVIKSWLNQNAKPTVNDLVCALKNNIVREQRIASEIEQTFLAPQQLKTWRSVPGEQVAKHESHYNRTDSSPAALPSQDAKVPAKISKSPNQHPLEKKQEFDCIHDNQPAYGCNCSVKCSLTEYLDKECPHEMSTTSHFPYLDINGLTEDEIETLCGRLLREFHQLNRKYSQLTSTVRKSLEERKITAYDLRNKLMDLSAIPIHEGPKLLEDRCLDMRSAETIQDIFYVLKDYSSELNPDIIEFIVDELGTENDKAKMDQYKQEFTKYCKRNVFECPLSPAPTTSSKIADLIIKVERGSNRKKYSLDAIKLICANVAELLNVTKHTLKLHNVKDGCIQCTLQFPRFLKTNIFPLNAKQKEGLRALGITKLRCDGFFHPLASPDEVPLLNYIT